ncbi:DUF221 domain-containing protein [Trichophyton equinum CBS 127.97]|uniref:DUF221 domain-containing protein n=1 Tax=Trichophyton equinum (strain ATCC MYA-4606 / CBS 127.97) TaxID=559882 RepID=F2PHX6_TRIEC|nr:DUF221 domain-containing protein [Trichophyton equinum CBS 127.97]
MGGLAQRDAPSSGAEEFLKLISNPFTSELNYNAFWVSLGTSIGITAGLALLFSLARPRNSVVYAPKLKHADKAHAPPPLGKGIFAWITPIIKLKEDELVERMGMDATIFLRFTRMCRNMFCVMSIVGCLIMIPINVHYSVRSIGKDKSLFDFMTPELVWGGPLWSNVACAWAFNFIIMYFLWHNYRAIHRLRIRYFQSPEYQKSLHARTVMVTHIPQNYRTDEGLLRLTDEVNPTASIPRASIGRNMRELPGLIKEHDTMVRKLEEVLAKYFKDPDNLPPTRPTCKPSKKDHSGHSTSEPVDAIDYYTDRVRRLEMEIRHVRESIDKRNAMPYGFASWDTIEDAHAVAFAARNKHPHGTTIRLAPRPNDIIWDNLGLTKSNLKWKRFMNAIWSTILTVIWIVPNAMIAIFLTNLSNLGKVWPAFQTSLNGNPKTWAAVQGIASPAILSLVYIVLPIIFRRLATTAGKKTKTARERHVIHSLYAFFVFNNLVVFSLFSSVWQLFAVIINASKNGEDAWKALQSNGTFQGFVIALIHVAPFWVNWLLQRNLGAAIDLVQIINMVWIFFARKFFSPTPRKYIEWTAPPPFEYASYYNYFLFYVTTALCFSTLQPIVLPVTALYFGVDSWLKKYLLLYIFVTKTESGGRYWRVIYNRVVFAVILSNFVTGLIVTARGTWTMVYSLAPLPLIMLGFKWYCRITFDNKMQYYSCALVTDPEAIASSKPSKKMVERLSSRFGHPALYKPLTTPMVHAKAAGALEKFYQSRQGLGAETGEYSDIAMHRMSSSRPGKSEHSRDRPFEVVAENQLDFSFFKDRPDFRDEFGGGIYGRPDDVFTERSNTPKSFLMGMGDSPSSSRASSPTPSTYSQQARGSMSFPSHTHSRVPHLSDHPAFQPNEPEEPSFYTAPNESERRLLSHAQTTPFRHDAEVASIDRWQSHTSEAREPSPSGFTPYRGHR